MMKRIAILALILITLFVSGCTDSGTQDVGTETVTQEEPETFEEVVENVTMQEPAAQTETPAINETQPEPTWQETRDKLLIRLQDEGYDVSYINIYHRKYDWGKERYMELHVPSREYARYELVNMSVIGYEYFPQMNYYTAKSTSSSLDDANSPLANKYYLKELDLVNYMGGMYEYSKVPVSSMI